MNEIESDSFFRKKYDPIVEKRTSLGSEIYNAPEVWDNDISIHEAE